MASFLEKKAQQEMMKRAIDAAWVGCTYIGMVIGPLAVAFDVERVTRPRLNEIIDTWLRQWQHDVQHLSDRNLHRNRDYHLVRPNLKLSPILAGFASQLQSIRASATLEPSQMLQAVKEACTTTTGELFDWFNWTKSSEVRSLIDFDASKYEPQAVQRAQKFWTPTVNEIKKAMG
jgi:hypothetical protein